MIQISINISNRKIVNASEFRQVLSTLKEGEYLITIKDSRKRSLHQNAYYWAVMVPMIRQGLYDAGFDEVRKNDDAHEIIKHVLLKKQVVSKQTGEFFDIAGSTASLSIPEFNEFIERVCKWSVEYLNVVIPSPYQQIAEFEDWESKIIDECY
jgi:hypothetical protein